MARIKIDKSLKLRCGNCGRENIRLSPTHNSFGHCGYICRRKECLSHVAQG